MRWNETKEKTNEHSSKIKWAARQLAAGYALCVHVRVHYERNERKIKKIKPSIEAMHFECINNVRCEVRLIAFNFGSTFQMKCHKNSFPKLNTHINRLEIFCFAFFFHRFSMLAFFFLNLLAVVVVSVVSVICPCHRLSSSKVETYGKEEEEKSQHLLECFAKSHFWYEWCGMVWCGVYDRRYILFFFVDYWFVVWFVGIGFLVSSAWMLIPKEMWRRKMKKKR